MSNPRIISGKAKGFRLQAVPGKITRPITDRVKEALFNILAPDIPDSTFLDLFGGTGSVGIEALSRGAQFVRFLDLHHSAVKTIKNNLKHTRLEQYAEVLNQDAFTYLKQPPDRQFEYVYIAPPQYKDLWVKAIKELDQSPGWLTDDAWVIVQIDPVEYQKLELNNLYEFEQRQYGSTLLVFYDTVEPEE